MEYIAQLLTADLSPGPASPDSVFERHDLNLFNLLERKRPEIEKLMRSVNGFEHYYLIRTGDGGMTITFCRDEAGAEESAQKAREWIGKNGSDIGAGALAIAKGRVVFEVK